MTQAEAAIDQMNEGWCAEMCALVVPPTDLLTCNQMVYCLLFNTTEAASWADIKTNMLSSGFKDRLRYSSISQESIDHVRATYLVMDSMTADNLGLMSNLCARMIDWTNAVLS